MSANGNGVMRAGRYADVRTSAQGNARPANPGGRGSARPQFPGRQRRAPGLFIPRLERHPALFMDWFWKELREGGWLYEYLRRERDTAPRRFRAVAREHERRGALNYQTEDVRHVASVPARDYFRIKAMDPDFFADKGNLKLLKKYNPDAVVTP